MNEQQELRHTELVNRLVIDRRTANEVGKIEQLWLMPQTHLVVGFTCKSGFLGKHKQSFTWAQIESIGADSIMVSSDPDSVDLEKPDDTITIIGHELWTDTGNKVGKIVDFIMFPDTGAVSHYLFSSSGWRGVMDGIYLLSPSSVISVGTKKVIVREAAVLEPTKYAEGLSYKLNQAAEFAQKDYEKTVDHWENLRRRTQTGTEGVVRGAQQLADELHNRANEVTEKVQTYRNRSNEPGVPEEPVEPVSKSDE